MSNAKAPRALLAGVTVSFGLVSFPVDLVPAQRSKAAKSADRPTVSNVCPTCEDPTPLGALLFCTEEGDDGTKLRHGPFAAADADKAMMVDGVLTKVTEKEIAAAKEPTVESRSVRFSVVPASQLEAATFPSGNIYRLRTKKPAKGTREAYALLHALMRDRSDVAFICEVVLKGATKLYRGIAKDDNIVLTELIRPGQLHEREDVDVEIDETQVKLGNLVLDGMLEDFDPQAWNDKAEERLDALRAAVKAGKNAEVADDTETTSAAAAADDLFALLERSVAEAA